MEFDSVGSCCCTKIYSGVFSRALTIVTSVYIITIFSFFSKELLRKLKPFIPSIMGSMNKGVSILHVGRDIYTKFMWKWRDSKGKIVYPRHYMFSYKLGLCIYVVEWPTWIKSYGVLGDYPLNLWKENETQNN